MVDVRAEAEHAIGLGWAGDFRVAEVLVPRLAALGARSEEAAGWGAALAAQRWHAEPSRGALPKLADVGRWVASREAGVRRAAAAVCVQGERAAVLSFDAEGLGRWVELHARAVEGAARDQDVIWLEVARAWDALFRDEVGELGARLRTLAADAAAVKSAPLVIETAALRGLGALLAGDLEEGVGSARRAVRMAQSEGLPQPQYLAHLVLARARRLSGRAHLATRILGALARVAPRVWQGWIRWEMLLAEGARAGTTEVLAAIDDAGAGLRDRAARGMSSLRAMLLGASRGDRAGFAAGAEGAWEETRGFPALAREVEPVAIACDPYGDLGRASPGLAAFCAGTAADAPPELQGLSALPEGGATQLAWVIAWPDRPARRVLGVGVPLAGKVRDVTEQRKRAPGRGETTIATLALAGAAGLGKAELFAQVYGFAYVAHLHQGVLDVLLHRVRGHLGETASLVRDREGERIVLTPHVPLAVPDPRCAGPLDDQVLRLLAQRGGGTAKDAAQSLGIPLRTAQAALQQLVQAGACILEREGRQVQYKVEDTTFSEPTVH